MAATDDDPRNLHDLAADAQTDIQKLAVGLAHAGVSPEAVSSLTKMGQVLGQIVKQLNASGEPPPQQGAAPQAASAPAPQGPPAAPPSNPNDHIHAAAQHLHQAMVASAQQRMAGGPQ